MENLPREKIESFYRDNKRMPTYSEMMKMFGFKSKNAVFKLVEKLMNAGLVSKDHLGRLIPTGSFGEVSVLGFVKAGFPSIAEEVRETINLNDFLISDSAKSFILEVEGDSMIDAHIAEGDMVLVEKTDHAKEGAIVIAEVDGEYTMKYLRRHGSKVWLEPANKLYKPIYPVYSLNIVAVVKAIIRKY